MGGSGSGGARPGAGRPKGGKPQPVGAVPVVQPAARVRFEGCEFTGYIDAGMYLRDGCVVFRVVAGHDQAEEALKMRLVEGNPVPLVVSIRPDPRFVAAQAKAREALSA